MYKGFKFIRRRKNMKLGFIGTGNMAGAIMGGVIKSNVFKPEEIIGADLFAPGREKVKELYGINVTDSNKEVIEKSEVVIFSCKTTVLCRCHSGSKRFGKTGNSLLSRLHQERHLHGLPNSLEKMLKLFVQCRTLRLWLEKV